METLQEVWNSQKRVGLESLVNSLESISEEDREEFINILDSFFDNEKKPIRPPMNPNATKSRRDSTSATGRNGYNKGGRQMRRRNSSRNASNSRGKENRGSRNNSRRRNRPQQQRRTSQNRRYSGNGNIGHEMKMHKEHQVNETNPQMCANVY